MIRKPIALVTGGAGFIGSHVVDLLINNNYEVRIIDNLMGGHEKNISHHRNNSNLKFENIDICKIKPDNSVFNNVDYVFHFAGIGDILPSIEKPFDYLNTNIMGTVNILEASRKNSLKKFLYAASSSCYGLAKVPTSESHQISPQYPYALSKYHGEQVAMHWNQVYKLPVNSIRIFNAYGPRVRTTGVYGAVFGVFLKQKLENKPLTIVGDGSQKRDFIYVTDVAMAFFKASKNIDNGQIYNLGAGNPQSINKLVEIIGGEVTYLPARPGEPDYTWADIKKISKELDWFPKVSFQEGVSIMLSKIENWKDAPLWDIDSINKTTKTWFQFMGK